MIIPSFSPTTNQVIVLHLTGSNATCGCAATCGCTPPVAKIAKQYNVPQTASNYITLNELNEFVDEVNVILERGYIPPLPILCTHFCIPFSPICIMGYYQNKRSKELAVLLEKKNASLRNCHWYVL